MLLEAIDMAALDSDWPCMSPETAPRTAAATQGWARPPGVRGDIFKGRNFPVRGSKVTPREVKIVNMYGSGARSVLNADLHTLCVPSVKSALKATPPINPLRAYQVPI